MAGAPIRSVCGWQWRHLIDERVAARSPQYILVTCKKLMISATLSNVVIVLTSLENVVITQGYPTLATVGDRVARPKAWSILLSLWTTMARALRGLEGKTPQVQWPSGRRQGESLDIVKALEPWKTLDSLGGWKKAETRGEQKTLGEKINGRVGGMYIADCF